MSDLNQYIPNLGKAGGPTVGSSDVNPNLTQTYQTTFTAAQIAAMTTSPLTVLPASGVGTVNVPDYIIVEALPGTAYTAGAAVNFCYGVGAGTSSTLIATALGTNIFYGTSTTAGSTAYVSISTGMIAGPNQNINMYTNAAFATGTAGAAVTVSYVTISV